MKKFLISILLLQTLKLFSLDINNPLPNWIDPLREKPNKSVKINIPSKAEYPETSFRLPAEYEPTQAVLISWAGYPQMLKEIAKAVTNKTGAKIFVMSGYNSISGVPSDMYQNFSIPIDSVWMRDYGPFTISKDRKKLAIIDSIYRHYQYRQQDDMVPRRLGEKLNLKVYGANLILDGGNLMVDSYGNLFMTKRTYMWNSDKSKEEVNNLLKKYFNVKNIYTFEYAGYPNEPLDGTGHIDMFMKLLNDNTVLIASADEEPFKSTFDKAAKFFKSRKAPNGKKYTILRIKGFYKKGYWGRGTWYTYTNSLIVNGYVLMPSFSDYTKYNSEAQKIYEKAGLKVIQINSDYSITAGGSIHCVTQVIPQTDSPVKKDIINVKPLKLNDVKLIVPIDVFNITDYTNQ